MHDHLAFVAVTLLAAVSAAAQPVSPYAGEQKREIKALSAEETSDYLAGRGMGLARAAELNGYPGPMHVLELAEPLALTAEQRVRTKMLFDSMRAQAIAAGNSLIEEERLLDAMFRDKAVDADALARTLERIAQRQAEVRRVHLAAHVAQVAILTPDQVKRYGELRGYGGAEPAPGAGHGHRRH